MDLDLDLNDDKIKEFLESKLSEIQNRNTDLQKKLQERQNFIKTSFNEDGTSNEVIEIVNVWKKIINNKFVIGFVIKNNSSRNISNVKTFIHSSINLFYTVTVFEESIDTPYLCCNETCMKITDNLKYCTNIQQLGSIIVSLQVPQFIYQLSYSIDGIVIYDDDDSKVGSFILPTVNISTDDINNRLLFLSPLQNDIKDLITLITALDKYEFVMILPHKWTISLETTFEIHCSMRKFNIEKSNCRLYFIATDNISPLFDGTVIEVHKSNSTNDSYIFKIFSRNIECVNNLLHHLYKSINGVLFLTLETFPIYSAIESLENDDESKCLSDFREILKQEMKFVHDFLSLTTSKREIELKKVIEFRKRLIDFEFKTDIAYMKKS